MSYRDGPCDPPDPVEVITLADVAKRLRDRFAKKLPALVSEAEYEVIANAAEFVRKAREHMMISESPFYNGMRELNKVVIGRE